MFGNGNVTYNQAFLAIQARRNATLELERQRLNDERRSKIEAEAPGRRRETRS